MWFAFAKKQAISLLNYFIAGVDIGVQSGAPVIVLKVAIQNPSNENFTVNAIVGNLYANNQLIGNVSSFVNVPVAGASQSLLPINVRISLIGIAADVYNLISNHNGLSQTINFKGTINASGIIAPIDLTYKIL